MTKLVTSLQVVQYSSYIYQQFQLYQQNRPGYSTFWGTHTSSNTVSLSEVGQFPYKVAHHIYPAIWPEFTLCDWSSNQQWNNIN